MLQSHRHLLSSNFPFPLTFNPPNSSFPQLPPSFHYKPINHFSVSLHRQAKPQPWIAQALETSTEIPIAVAPEEGPIELPSSTPSIFATTDDPSPIQIATSVLLTGSISIFLFRALRRRAKRVKELRFRSSGAKKSLKEEALDSLKAMGPASMKPDSPPSPVQALLGGVTAGVIALILYKFATTIEASLNRQTLSDSFSVRQITVTIRTIINGLCYLATFVFGFNSLGLFLYSGQLAINSLMEESSSKQTESKGEEQLSSSNASAETPVESTKEDQNSNDMQ